MKTKSALILTWSGYQDQEVIYPFYRLKGAGFETKIVGDKKDQQGRIYGIFGVNMPCEILLNDFNANHEYYLENFNLLVLPGGVKALEKLRQEKQAINFIQKWNSKKKIIASTCHGAQLLISAQIVKNRQITGYYSIEDDIVNAGAEYKNEPFLISQNIVSSPHYDHMGIWMEEVLSLHNQWYENEK